MAIVVVAILLSQFGTIRGGAPPLDRREEDLTGTGNLGRPWRAIRGEWSRTEVGAAVTRPGDRLSVAVRPVGGVDGSLEVTGLTGVDGWSLVWRWEDAGTYGLVVVEPSEGSISLVEVVSDRTRLLAEAPLPPAGNAPGAVVIELAGPVVKARIDGAVAVAGRADRLTTGTLAGVAVLGEPDGARFASFRSQPPEAAEVREVEPGGAP
ncbi:hypothetical protein BH24ACT4_BH24ACT4_18510 [soil metagenome]